MTDTAGAAVAPTTIVAEPGAAPDAGAPEGIARPGSFRDRVESRPRPDPTMDEPAGPVAPGDESLDPELAAASGVTGEDGIVSEDGFSEDGEPAPTDLFGMPRDEFMTALESAEDGVLPESLYENIKVKITRDGVDEFVPLSEWRDGGLRQSDYSRKLNTLREDRSAFDQTQNNFAQMINGWKAKPHTMADDLELLGIDLEAVLEPVAAMYAAEADMTPRERELARRAREAERRERMSRLRQRTEQAALDREKQGQRDNEIEERIASYRVPALQAAKVQDGPVARRIFNEHLRNFWQSGDLTPKHAADAAQATREDLIQMARDYQSQTRPAPEPKPEGAPAPTQRAAAGPPAPRGAAPGGGGPAARQPGGTVRDFRGHIERLRERGQR